MRGLAALLGVGALALLWSRRADASINPVPDPGVAGQEQGWELFSGWEWGAYTPDPFLDAPAPVYEADDMSPIYAFLYMIRRAEHSASDVAAGLDWLTFYGGSRFGTYSDHPVLTGEKQGVPLPPDWCTAAGFSPGCVSTAAGAFQINVPTWRRVRAKHPYLSDFSPANQEQAAIRLLAERGALRLIQQGRIEEAIYKAAPIWASLPRSAADAGASSSTTQQGRKSPAQVLAYYQTGLAMA